MQNWDKSHTQELNKWFNIETYKNSKIYHCTCSTMNFRPEPIF